jgi:hypothetical protein
MNSHEPSHRNLLALGVFFAGLGILLAGIALLIWVCRPAPAPAPTPLPPLVTNSRPPSDEEVRKFIAGHKDLEEMIDNSELHRKLIDFGKETPKDQTEKTEKTTNRRVDPQAGH